MGREVDDWWRKPPDEDSELTLDMMRAAFDSCRVNSPPELVYVPGEGLFVRNDDGTWERAHYGQS